MDDWLRGGAEEATAQCVQVTTEEHGFVALGIVSEGLARSRNDRVPPCITYPRRDLGAVF